MKSLLVIAMAFAIGAGGAVAQPTYRGGPPPFPEPEALAARMFAEHDTDENNALTQEELTRAFAALQAERRSANPNCRASVAERDRMTAAGRGSWGRRGPAEPADVAAYFIARYDHSGDQALSLEELLPALEQRANGRGLMRGVGGRGPSR